MSARPLLIAHRAGNHAAGVGPALAAGADLVEIDVHMHRGRLEVRHPRRAGPVLWDRAGIRRAGGTPPPALEEILERLPAGAEPMLDLKQGPAALAGSALAACRRHGFAAVTVASRRWDLVDGLVGEEGARVVHSAAGGLELARLLRRPPPLRPRVVCARRNLLGAGSARTILAVAEALMTWPVHDAADARLLAGWGVGGLICDDLGLLARLAADPPSRWGEGVRSGNAAICGEPGGRAD